MSRNTCVIYDSDLDYAKRLMGVINDNKDIPLRAEVFTDKEDLASYLKNYEPEVLMINEEVYEYCPNKDKVKKIVLLTEDEKRKSEESANLEMVCKYQASKEIVNGLFLRKRRGASLAKTSIVGVLGMNASKRTVLSLALAKAYSKKGQTLFISLEEFAGLSCILTKKNDKSLSDAIYYFKQNKMQYHEKIETTIQNEDGLDYINPVDLAEDISYLTSKGLNAFVKSLGEELGYDTIVLDIGNGIMSPWEIYESCNKLFMPKASNFFEKAREADLVSYFNETGMEGLLDNIREVNVNLGEECMDGQLMRRIEYSNLYAKVNEVINAN